MTELVIQATDGSGRWPFSQQEVTIGREPHCDLVIDGNRYPTVSRFHALLRRQPNGGYEIQNLGSANGLLVNGVEIMQAVLHGGDRVQLGATGPEFVVQAGLGQAAGAPSGRPAPSAGIETVVVGAGGVPSAAQGSSSAFSLGGVASNRRDDPPSSAAGERPTPPAPALRSHPAATGAHATPSAARPEPELSAVAASLRRQILSVRSALVASMVLNVVLVGFLYYQISRTQDQVRALRSSAHNAIGMLAPQLDQRLNRFQSQLDQANVQMKQSQDEFFARAHREIPEILDSYVNRKLKQVQSLRGLSH